MKDKGETSYILNLNKTIDSLNEKLRKSNIKISRLEKLNSKLISENKTLQQAWHQTESRWKKNVANKSLKQIMKEIKEEQDQ